MNRLDLDLVYSKGYVGPDGEPGPYEPCPYCGQPLYYTGIRFGDSVTWAKKDRCSCEGAQEARREEAERKAAEEKAKRLWEKQREVKRLMKLSGIKKSFQSKTFESFTPRDPAAAKAKKKAEEYVATFQHGAPRTEKNSLLLCGPVGVGKTHLASAIANELISGLTDVVILTPTEMLDRQREAYSAQTGEMGIREVTESLKKASLLILDDLGKDRMTEWGLGRLFDVINARYEDLMPMVVTTNESPGELIKRLTPANGYTTTAQAIVDRLIERCEIVPLTGKSYRSRARSGKENP